MSEIISKTIKIKAKALPPKVEFIEAEIIKSGLEPLRWAIVEVSNNEITLSVSGRKLN